MRAEFAPVALREDGGHLVEHWQALVNFRGPGQTLEMIMRYYPDHLRGGAHRHWGHRAAFNYSYPEHLPRVMPFIRDGRLLERPDWGHGFLDLHTAELGAIVREFFDG